MTDLSQQVIDLSNLRTGLDQLMLAIQPAGVDVAGLDNARKRFAETVPMFAALVDGPLGVSAEDTKPQVSAENAAKLKRLGIDPKYAGITCESELFELRDNDAARKAFAELKANNVSVNFEGCTNESDALARIAVARAKSKGVAAARSRFGN